MKKILFKDYYRMIICEDFILKEQIINSEQIPTINSLTISHSSQFITSNSNYLVPAFSLMELISGQKPIKTNTKKSVAAFKTRTNQCIGCKVTLHQNRSYFFLEKLFFVFLVRLNEYEKKQVNQCNYQFGIDEQILLFPEIESFYDLFEFVKGCHVQITTSATCQKSTRLLLSSFKIYV